MKKLILVVLLSLPTFVFAQTTGDYRTVIGFFGSENWSSLAAWERWNGGSWVQPTALQGYPGQLSTPTNVTYNDAFSQLTLDVSPAFPLNNFSIATGFLGFFGTSGNVNLTLNGNLSLGAIDFLTFDGTGNLIVNGSSTIDGIFQDANNGGLSRFVGTVVLSNTSTWTSTAVTTTANMVFRGGMVNNSGGFDAGGATFDTNNQDILGSSDWTFGNNVAIAGIRLTNQNLGNLTITGTTTLSGGAGGFTDSNNTGITTLIGNLSVGAGTSFVTTAVTTTANLIFRGGIANAGTFTGGGATFNTNNQSLTGASSISFANNVAINNITVTNSNTGTLTITGTTTLTNGGFTDSDNTSADIFVGNVSQSGTSAFNTTGVTTNGNMIFRGGIANNGGTFTAGAADFTVNSQALTGTADISFANFVVVTGVTVTNSNTLSVSLTRVAGAITLAGTGGWVQGANSTLNYTGTSIGLTGGFIASNSGNTVNYNSTTSAQTIFNPTGSTYFHLTLSGTGNQTKTLSANTILSGNLSIQNTAIFSVSTFTLSVAGNWSNSSTNADPFTQGTQTVTLNGAAAQTISNTGDAQGTDFNNLTINNTFATSPQITTSAAISVAGVLTMTQGNTNLNGNTITLTSSAAGALVHGLTSASGWMYGTGAFKRTFANTTAIAVGTAQGLFPLGSSTDWRPFFVGVNSSANTAGTIAVTHTNAATTSVVSYADTNPVATIVRKHDALWTPTFTGITGGTWDLRAGGTTFGTIAAGAGDIRMSTNTGVVGTNAAGSGGPTDWRVNRTGLTAAQVGANSFHLSSTNAGTSPLPVKLLYFTAKLSGNEVMTQWATAEEINNDFFTIEKSLNPENGFQTVSKVSGKGNSNVKQVYSLMDKDPYNGVSYYRLKQTDFDGKFTYSKLVMVNYEGSSLASLSVYPNPLKDKQTIKVEMTGLKGVNEVPIVIYNFIGQKILEKTIAVDLGGQIHEEFSFEKPLSPGVFIVKAGPTLQLTQRLVVE